MATTCCTLLALAVAGCILYVAIWTAVGASILTRTRWVLRDAFMAWQSAAKVRIKEAVERARESSTVVDGLQSNALRSIER